MLRQLMIAVSVFLFVSGATAQEVPPSADAVLDRDFALMMSWFPGRYDNMEQVYFNEEMNVPAEERHERIHHIFAPVTLKGFEGRTFYVQQYTDDDPAKIYRQRIYVFSPDYAQKAIRLDILTPKNPAALIDAHLDAKKLARLKKSDLEARPGCEVYWRREANQFRGEMKERACTFISARSGQRIFIDDDLLLTENEIWIKDVGTAEDGTMIFGNKAGVPHKNRKARPFTCWMAVKRNTGEGFYFKDKLALHDQGGHASVTTDEAEPQTYSFRIRNVEWPYGAREPSLVLYVDKAGEKAAVSYAWADPGATRIGINLRILQGSCSLDETASLTP